MSYLPTEGVFDWLATTFPSGVFGKLSTSTVGTAMDPVAVLARTKDAYRRDRGVDAAGNPKTTWGDVASFGTAFRDAVNVGDFVRTPSYLAAWGKYGLSLPLIKAGAAVGDDPISLKATRYAVERFKQIYPYNSEFWSAASKYAIARGGAGMVPTNWQIAASSIKEAVNELPATLKKALPPIPDVNPLFNMISALIKWGTIGAGVYVLWTIVKPESMKAKGPTP
jgi:hypothetical protein